MQDDTQSHLEKQQTQIPLNAFYLVQGELRKVAFVQGESAAQRKRGAKRGKITSFSNASRRRLLHLFARLDVRKAKAVFLTLTFHEIPTAAHAKKVFKRFTERLRRHFPKMAFIWRLERQKRGSIHYHLIMFNFPFVPQAIIQKWWESCTLEDMSRVYIEFIHGKRKVFNYISKYCAKPTEQVFSSLESSAYQHDERSESELIEFKKQLNDAANTPQIEGDGRIWGIFQNWALPYAQFTAYRITDFDHALYLRWRGLQLAKVQYCPSKFSNIQFMEFGGGGRLLVGLESIPLLEHHIAQRLCFKYNWY